MRDKKKMKFKRMAHQKSKKGNKNKKKKQGNHQKCFSCSFRQYMSGVCVCVCAKRHSCPHGGSLRNIPLQ